MYFCHTVAINFDRCIQRFIWSRGPLESACWMESVTVIKSDTSHLCIGSGELPSSKPKVVKLCTTSPPPSATNNNAKLVKTARHTTHFFHDWVTGTFSPLKFFFFFTLLPRAWLSQKRPPWHFKQIQMWATCFQSWAEVCPLHPKPPNP